MTGAEYFKKFVEIPQDVFETDENGPAEVLEIKTATDNPRRIREKMIISLLGVTLRAICRRIYGTVPVEQLLMRRIRRAEEGIDRLWNKSCEISRAEGIPFTISIYSGFWFKRCETSICEHEHAIAVVMVHMHRED